MSHTTYLAESKDGERILEILECSPAKGNIELLYTRRPNAYLSYKKESNESDVFVVKSDIFAFYLYKSRPFCYNEGG